MDTSANLMCANELESAVEYSIHQESCFEDSDTMPNILTKSIKKEYEEETVARSITPRQSVVPVDSMVKPELEENNIAMDTSANLMFVEKVEIVEYSINQESCFEDSETTPNILTKSMKKEYEEETVARSMSPHQAVVPVDSMVKPELEENNSEFTNTLAFCEYPLECDSEESNDIESSHQFDGCGMEFNQPGFLTKTHNQESCFEDSDATPNILTKSIKKEYEEETAAMSMSPHQAVVPVDSTVKPELEEINSEFTNTLASCEFKLECDSEDSNESVSSQEFDASEVEFNQAGCLTKPQGENAEEKPYKCDICGKGFKWNGTLTYHYRIHSGEKLCKCDVCGKGFSDEDALTYHCRIHSGEKRCKCDVCGKGFSNEDALTEHFKRHTPKIPFKCDICGMESNMGNLFEISKHYKTHTGEKPSKFWRCGKGISQSGTLAKNKGLLSGQTLYKCGIPFCGKVFSQYSSQITHYNRVHSGERPYKCHVCGKGFKWNSLLTEHYRTHTAYGEKPYKCDVCGKRFDKNGTLSNHYRQHSREKQMYKCHTCGMKFSLHSALTKHYKTHTGEKQYKCDVCGKEYCHKAGLTKHQAIHSGENKPFKCHYCDMAFGDSNALHTHYKLYSGKNHTPVAAVERDQVKMGP